MCGLLTPKWRPEFDPRRHESTYISYEWTPTRRGPLSLASPTERHGVTAHPHCSSSQCFVPSRGRVASRRGADTVPFIVCLLTDTCMFPPSGPCGRCCRDHVHLPVSVWMWTRFVLLGVVAVALPLI